jgi:hypothetical protein
MEKWLIIAVIQILCDNEHRHSGINYVTPSERHAGKDRKLGEKKRTI